MNEIKKDREIFRVMRKVLTQIIKDTTVQKGFQHPLQDSTKEDICLCLGLISAREKELAEKDGLILNEKPVYADENITTKKVFIYMYFRVWHELS